MEEGVSEGESGERVISERHLSLQVACNKTQRAIRRKLILLRAQCIEKAQQQIYTTEMYHEGECTSASPRYASMEVWE